LLGLLLLLPACHAWPQSGSLFTGGVYGTVRTDQRLGVPPSLRILAIGQWDRAAVTTNKDGSFRVTGLRPGPYTFIAVGSGFCQTNEVYDTVTANQVKDLSGKPLLLSASSTECFAAEQAFVPMVKACFGDMQNNSGTIRLHGSDGNGEPLTRRSEVKIEASATKHRCEFHNQDVSATLDIIAMPPGKYQVTVDPEGRAKDTKTVEVQASKVTYVQFDFPADGKKRIERTRSTSKK
jgi:hypothetical protein